MEAYVKFLEQQNAQSLYEIRKLKQELELTPDNHTQTLREALSMYISERGKLQCELMDKNAELESLKKVLLEPKQDKKFVNDALTQKHLESGNIFISYGLFDDVIASKQGYTFIGVSQSKEDGEVHIWLIKELE